MSNQSNTPPRGLDPLVFPRLVAQALQPKIAAHRGKSADELASMAYAIGWAAYHVISPNTDPSPFTNEDAAKAAFITIMGAAINGACVLLPHGSPVEIVTLAFHAAQATTQLLAQARPPAEPPRAPMAAPQQQFQPQFQQQQQFQQPPSPGFVHQQQMPVYQPGPAPSAPTAAPWAGMVPGMPAPGSVDRSPFPDPPGVRGAFSKTSQKLPGVNNPFEITTQVFEPAAPVPEAPAAAAPAAAPFPPPGVAVIVAAPDAPAAPYDTE